jgi:uncharacterized protein (DUF885 family)
MPAQGTIRSLNRAFLVVASGMLLCSAASIAEKSTAAGAGEMRAVIEQFTADSDALAGTYTVRISPVHIARFEKFFGDEQARLQQMNFDALSEEDKIDYLLLKNHLTAEQHHLAIEKKRAEEMEPLIPFAKTIEELADGLRTMRRPDPEKAAGALNEMVKQIAATQKALDPTLHKDPHDASDGNTATPMINTKVNPIVAYRAERAVEQLSSSLKKWYDFYNSYDPAFTWWLGMPYKDAQKSLASYQGFLKEKLVGIPDDDKTTIIGDPVGRDALMAELQDNMIPYTPEELMAIAQTEMDWCMKEMLKASREMGYGDDWHKALEHVKQMHVPPGEQPELIRQLVVQGSEFVKQHDMVTVPELADETWRMIMMTPHRQLVNPFFTGGDEISVSYPTDTMTFEQREMSMRGNNTPFSHATAFHEMIPGHFLQYYIASRYHTYRQIFDTPFWAEGDAFQWEMELYDMGFHKTPEERVGALFWRMHRSARVMFTMHFHLGEWTPKQCVDYLISAVGHEPDNATAEVRRSFDGSVGPLYQCAYLMGALQIRSLRKELVDSHKMTERQFHDAILQEGPMPIELMRALLTNQQVTRDFKTSWDYYGPHPTHP